jgi:uncharacterized lipoprotein YbaY
MTRAPAFIAALAALVLAGCAGHIDVTPEGNPARVLIGRVELGDGAALPPDAVVTVRVLDGSIAGMPPQVLGSQTLHPEAGSAPLEFRVEYRAEDWLLRQGLNVDVRVSAGGQVRYFNRNRYAITYGNAADVHRITVNPTEQQ